MEMRCKDLLRNSLKALHIRFVECSNWGQTLHEATVGLLDTCCSILADLLNERHGLYRRACLEEDH
jgi:hypothetical protein